MTHDPFDHQRDAELGAILRTHLDAGDHPAFTARVRRALAARGNVGPFEVLSGWLRPGIAAAALIAFLAGWWITSGARTEVASGTPLEIFAGTSTAGTDLMLATALEPR